MFSLKILLVGGSKSGKSLLAQSLAQKLRQNNGNLYYIATMKPRDDEDKARIKRHISERDGFGFETLEKAADISELTNTINKNDTILLDSLTSLLANEMFAGGEVNTKAYLKAAMETKQLCEAAGNAIIVSDYIFSDAVVYDELTNQYIRGLAQINKSTTDYCDIVLEMNNSVCVCHKGEELYSNII